MNEWGNRVFVTRVAAELTKEDLEAYFAQFGELTDIFVPLRNPNAEPQDGMHKGIAFVSFKDRETYEEVLSRDLYEIKPGVFIVVEKVLGGFGGFAEEEGGVWGLYGGGSFCRGGCSCGVHRFLSLWVQPWFAPREDEDVDRNAPPLARLPSALLPRVSFKAVPWRMDRVVVGLAGLMRRECDPIVLTMCFIMASISDRVHVKWRSGRKFPLS